MTEQATPVPMKGVMVVIPTYNEKQNILRLIPELLELRTPGFRLELLIVDDNSPDGTGHLVRRMARFDERVHLLTRPKKLGLGRAYIAGFKEALSREWVDYIVQMDADFSHDPQVVPRLLDKVQTHDVAVGSRYINGVSVVNWPIWRLVLSASANRYAAVVTGLQELTDITGGFKCFRREALEAINLDHVEAVGYAFQIEMNYRAVRNGCRIGEVPIVFVDRHAGSSKLDRALVTEALWMVWRLRLGLYRK